MILEIDYSTQGGGRAGGSQPVAPPNTPTAPLGTQIATGARLRKHEID